MSTAEAEFAALEFTVRDVIWMRNTLADLQLLVKPKTVNKQDNLGNISWTENVQGLRKFKYVCIRYNYVREAVDTAQVTVKYTPSEKNRADSLTKILWKEMYSAHMAYLVSK